MLNGFFVVAVMRGVVALYWHLMYTKPKKEPQVNRLLQEQGIETFFPVVQLEHGKRRDVQIEPFFPHYLFFRADLQSAETSGLQWLAGTRAIVNFGGQPAVIPDEVVAEMQQRLQPYTESVLHKGEWLYQPGDRVEVVKGPFAGMEAIFQRGISGKDRVQLMLHVLGAWNRVEMRTDEIAAYPG